MSWDWQLVCLREKQAASQGRLWRLTAPGRRCLSRPGRRACNCLSHLPFQKILGSDGAFRSRLQYFGRSLDGFGDLNGDSITDVSIGALGQVVQLW